MAGEIQLNSTTMATESSGSITAQLDVIRPNTTNGSLTLQGDSSDAGVTGLTIDSSGVVNTTTAKVTNLQATSGQSLIIKDEDGNAAITIGTDNTATGYLSLNFGSHSSSTGSLTSSTLSDYEEGTFSPTVSSTSGTITTVSANGFYRKIGPTVICFIDFTVTTNGTGAGLGSISGLPFTTTASSESSGAMRIDGFNGATASFTLDKSATSLTLTKYDNTYPFGNNARGTLVVPYIVA